jgi:molybdopterin-guanine dinucleotide biosynthesis protein A
VRNRGICSPAERVVFFVVRVDSESQSPFSAALLAGGKSSRMGSDKAAVEIGGEPLWRHQLGTLRAVGPREILISGKVDGPYAGAGVEIVRDTIPDCGPLSGIEAVLARAAHPLVLVLAIDLPAMTAEFLRAVVKEAHDRRCGVVLHRCARFEPLAAVYPQGALPLARECLRSGDCSLQNFVRLAIGQGLLHTREPRLDEERLFLNLNTLTDLPDARGGARGNG